MKKLANGLLAAAALMMVADTATAQREEGDPAPEAQRDGDGAEGGRRGDRDDDRPRGDRPRGDRERGDRGPRDGEGWRGGFRDNPIIVALDADRDGVISADEIKNAAAALRKLDKNEDGKLTREELGPMGPPEGRRFGGPPDGDRGRFSVEQMVARMLEADADDDGKLSKDEAPERMRRGFERADKNSDGNLDKSELEAMAKQAMERMRDGEFRGQGRGGREGAGRGGRGGERDSDRPRRPPVQDDDE